MRIINPPMPTVQGVCGAQKYRSGVQYRPSKHCISVQCEEGTLVYHTLTGALSLLLPNGEMPEKTRQGLIRGWYLVPEDFNERKHADDVKNIVRMLQPKGPEKTDFTILTTTDCNARCFYCYELGFKRISMSGETARAAAEYIARACGGKPVRLRWFGGEPLYNRDAIDTICGVLQKHGVSYESSMVSNGYYLDGATVKKAVDDWHLKKVQITIDGTEEIYNRTKAYIDAEGNPYATVMDNIQFALQAGITVTIRLNMDARNAEDLLLLLDNIGARFRGHEKLNGYVALLREFKGTIHRHESETQTELAFFALRDKMSGMGLLRRKKLPTEMKINRCMADNNVCETILPDGRVGRCEHFSEEMVTGDIWSAARDAEVETKWKAPLYVPECGECALYPQCTKLSLCEWNRDGCDKLDRSVRIIDLKRKMIEAYQVYNKER